MANPSLRTFKDLVVWQKSYQLCLRVYAATARFPTDERYGLMTQLRRAAVSVPSNIAEGYNRRGRKDHVRFCSVALGSPAELETQLMLARDLKLCNNTDAVGLAEDVEEVQRMLKALIRSLDRCETPDAARPP